MKSSFSLFTESKANKALNQDYVNAQIDIEPLKKLLEHPQMKYRKIVVIAKLGSLENDKNYFMKKCLQFMYSNYKSINNLNQSNSFEMQPINGITIVNDVFLYDEPSTGEKFGILLMNSQEFLNNNAVDNSIIFTVGTLISSIQLLTINRIVHEDQTEYLKFTKHFAEFVITDNSQETEIKPFQKLIFLIKNLNDNDDAESGEQNFVKDVFHTNGNLNQLKSIAKDSFEKVNYLSLPKASNDDFDDKLQRIIENLLSPNQLVTKKINEKELTSIEYLGYVQKYFELFKSQKSFPNTRTFYESTVNKQNQNLIDESLTLYRMFIYSRMKTLLNIDEIPNIHENSLNEILSYYRTVNKMGNSFEHKKFEEILFEKIEDNYNQWKNEMQSKIEKIEDENERRKVAQLEAKINSCILNIELDSIDAAVDLFKEINDESQIERVVKEIYLKNPKNIEILLRFSRNLENISWTGMAYKMLQNFINPEHLMILAFNVKETMNEQSFQNANQEEKKLFEDIKSNFDPNIRALTWGGTCALRNFNFNEYLYPEGNQFNYDNERRSVFTRKQGDVQNDKKWEIIPTSDGYVYIRHLNKQEYLYADDDTKAYDSDRRNVFTWIPKNILDPKFKWKIISIPFSPFIQMNLLQNQRFDEFFYAFDDPSPDQYRRRVFTWRRKVFDNQMFWIFEC
ncbi:hypothetical protein PVAND_016393 [Polypedilum vanderplanki]|uniref:Guanylate-binding protein N-terminal domain-containing protein n=1 Tax=Polypedilum vanderplanki TaxID=319348 RepID=A0A9J6BFB2_POLVA|nr:hypothetical protein PVAND_016393 [Polypedilum vanderplanki]